MLPNGDVLVAETNAPPKETHGHQGLRDEAGAEGRRRRHRPAPNRITLLRDADGDGTAETRSVFLEDLNSPFGMALVGDDFYVANADAVMRFPYEHGPDRDHGAPAPSSPTCRAGRSTTTGPRT